MKRAYTKVERAAVADWRDHAGIGQFPGLPNQVRVNLKRLAKAFPMIDPTPTIAAASAFSADDDIITRRIRRLMTEEERRRFAARDGHLGGRDGQKLQITTAKAQVNERAGGMPQWAAFDVIHPIEKMRARGSLGSDEVQSNRRYRAARVWFHFWAKAQGLGSSGEWLQEHVDGSGDPQSGMAARMDASMQRMNVADQPGMTRRRFDDLDSVCGAGFKLAEVGKRTNRAANSVRESLLAGLDVVGAYPNWDRQLESVPVLYIEAIRRAS